MPHDFENQRAETRAAFDEMQAEQGLPEEADIDYFFVAAREDADWRELAEALTREEFECEFIEDDTDTPYLVATLRDQAVSAQGIWIGEELATRIALEHGFAPDGWGLEG